MRLSDYIKKDSSIISETDRAVMLPLVWDYPPSMDWAEKTFSLPECSWKFRQAQADALYAMRQNKGLLAPIGVGHGKTLICYLAPEALQVERAVVMMPPRDIKPYEIETARYAKQFRVGDCLTTVVPYSLLSQPNSSDLLDRLAPQAIICDEAHNLAHASASKTIRFLRYMDEHPATLFVAMSGTLYRNSITDVAHLSRLALRVASPMPRDGEELEAWARILDVGGIAERNEYAWFEGNVVQKMRLGDEIQGAVKRSRKAAYMRLASAPGVVTTETASCASELIINRVHLEPPDNIVEMINEVRKTRLAPDKEDFYETEAHLVGAMRNIACGFYYKWDWQAIGGRNDDWLMRRTAWLRSLHKELLGNSRVGYDSPKLISDEIDRQLDADPDMAMVTMLHFARSKWNEVSHLPVPPRLTVWLDKYVIDYALEQYGNTDCILWYDSQAFEQELERRCVAIYGHGTFLTGPERFLAASINVHGQARNLQDWCRGVVLEPSMGGATWEQLLGRMHRGGQVRSVQYDVLLPGAMFEDSLAKAKADARFINDVSGSPQRLLTATWK